MSRYNRKGGSGKSGSLRQQFTYYKRQLLKRLIDEESFERAMGGGADITPSNIFKRLDFKSIFEQGITRKVGNKTIRIYGEEAIQVQIGSLKRRSSKSEQSQQFIENYVSGLTFSGFDNRGNEIGLGMPIEYAEKVYKKLLSISTDKLTYLVRKGILPQIAFLYSETQSWEEVYDDIMNAINNGVDKETLKDIRTKKKQLKPLIEKEFKIMYRW